MMIYTLRDIFSILLLQIKQGEHMKIVKIFSCILLACSFLVMNIFFTARPIEAYSEQKLVAGDGGAGDQFGYSVAIDGDYAMIGAPSDVVGSNTSGSVYIFTRNGTTWTQQQQLTASDGAANTHFGNSVAKFDLFVVWIPLISVLILG
jgi:hypothetical protein